MTTDLLGNQEMKRKLRANAQRMKSAPSSDFAAEWILTMIQDDQAEA